MNDVVLDMNGREVRAGDEVVAYPHMGVKRNGVVGIVKCIADMNEIQTNMVYLYGLGAWHPKSVEKVRSRIDDE